MPSGERRPRARVSVARALSKLGAASRARARRLVAEGRVAVNGRVVRDPDARLDPRTDALALDGRRVRPARRVYFALHKPAGVVTTSSDERGRRTVFDILPPRLRRLSAVGRLDRETTGLLLLTNDTRFGNRVASPASGVAKVYRATLDRPLSEADRGAMARGMTLPEGTPLRPAGVSVPAPGGLIVEITLHEGRNRQVRRMCEALGYAVTALHRVAVGPVLLGDLAEGAVRELTAAEVAALSTEPPRE